MLLVWLCSFTEHKKIRFCGPLVKIWLARERVGVVWGVGAVGCAVWVGRGESGIVSTGLEV